jgi:hypothetical protein
MGGKTGRVDGWFVALVAALLLAPHLFVGRYYSNHLPILGPAQVVSGDEPHYLLMLNSLLDDGDLDLSNQYAAVHAGMTAAGA